MGTNRGTCLKSIKGSPEIVPGANCLLTDDYLDFGGPLSLELHMQGDGNVCIYSAGKYVWYARNKALPQGDYFLYVTQDGNLAAYSGTPDNSGDMVWSTGTGGSSLDYHYSLGVTAITPLGGSVPVLYVALWSGDCSGPDVKDQLLGVSWKIPVGP